MPKVKLNVNPTDEDIKAKISEYLTRRDMTVEHLCSRAGISKSAYHNYMNNPASLRIGTLRDIYRVLKVPQEEQKGV